jgi:hypothetical protein
LGAIAQRLEQRTHNPSVSGSNPGCPTFLSQFGQASIYTEVSSRIGFWAGSKRRKSIKKKRAVLNNTSLFFFNRFSAAFNPAKKPILELTSV